MTAHCATGLKKNTIRRTASGPIFGVTTEFYVASVINAEDWAAPGDKRS